MSELTIEEVKSRLRKLFMFYACYGQRSNQNFLKSGKFQKMLQDAGVIDQVMNKKQVDLIFCSENKHRPNCTFEVFLEIIARVAREKYYEIYQQAPFESLKALLVNHLFPLYDALKQQQEIESFDQNQFQLDETSVELLRSVLSVFRQIYNVHFPWEVASKESIEVISNRSQKKLLTFIRDFDLCPSLVSKATVFKLWQEMVSMGQCVVQVVQQEEDVGTVFKFSIFMEFLSRCALLGYEEGMTVELAPNERVALLLERMEMSRGFQEHEKLTHRTHMSKTSLLPPKKMLESISSQLERSMSMHSVQEAPEADVSALSLDQNGLLILEKYVDRVHRIFQAYCSFGEPLNTTRMKSSKLVKLLKDAGILKQAVLESYPVSRAQTPQISTQKSGIRQLSKVDMDLIFVKLTGTVNKKPGTAQKGSLNKGMRESSHLSLSNSNHCGRMEFQQFLKSLEFISMKLFPETSLEEGFVYLLEEFIIPLEQKCVEKGIGNLKIISQLESLQDPELIECLSLVHRSVQPFYRYYCDTKDLMNLSNFIKFSKDFGMFPDIISKGKLLELFYTLASIQASTEVPSNSQSRQHAQEQTESELIDEHLFVEALALISFEIQQVDPQPSQIEKICYLMERMSQSEGIYSVQKLSGSTRAGPEGIDFLYLLKQKYPEMFYKSEPQLPPSFNQMMGFE